MPADATAHRLASRPARASIEAPSIVRRGGFYYLFLSLDFCCRGVNSDYRTVVGRSTSVTGPYTDRDGVPLLAGGGTDLLRGYNEFAGTGGGDVFSNGDWFAHHYYDTADNGLPQLSVRGVVDRGWPAWRPALRQPRPGHGPAFQGGRTTPSARLDNPTCGYEGADIRIAPIATVPARVAVRGPGRRLASLTSSTATRSPRSPPASTPTAPGLPSGAG